MFYKNDSYIINISTSVLTVENVTVLCICIRWFYESDNFYKSTAENLGSLNLHC